MDARTLWLGSFCVAATLATLVGTGSSVARARVDCDSIAGSADVIAPGRVLLLGELHGTTQSPAFVSSLSCNALAAGLDLVVGLELSPSARPGLDRFLESAGTAEDRERMVSGSLWQRDYQDGRTSRAIVELVEQLRALRHAGHSVEVVLFDAPGAGGGQQRERAMARNLATSARARAESMHVILTGNLHSRVFPGSMRSSEYEPMGYLLKQALSAGRVISLDVGHAGGTAWVCNPSCGVATLGGREGDPPGRIERNDETRPAGHDGWYRVGRITASPPASGRFDEAEFEKQVEPGPAPKKSPARSAPRSARPVEQALPAKWQGHWQAHLFDSRYWTIRFEGHSFRAVVGPDDWYEGTTELRPDLSPAELDIHIRDCHCSYVGETSKAIYRWEGNSIILSAPRPGNPRPTLFDDRSGQVVRLERIPD